MDVDVISASRGLLATFQVKNRWASISHHTLPACLVSTSDLLYFLGYRKYRKALLNSHPATHPISSVWHGRAASALPKNIIVKKSIHLAGRRTILMAVCISFGDNQSARYAPISAPAWSSHRRRFSTKCQQWLTVNITESHRGWRLCAGVSGSP